jgi:predicted ATP-grasp superfamily ATP-dependent carboligase
MFSSKKTILILAGTGRRAVIATLRALKNSDTSIYLSFDKKSVLNRIAYHRYNKNTPLYYDQTSEDAFIRSLISIRDIIGGYTLLPHGETLSRWAIKRKNELEKVGIILPTVDFEKYTLFSDKGSFIDLCKDSSIDIPQEVDINWSKFERKFVVKPKKPINDQRCLKSPALVENSSSFQKLKEQNVDITKHLFQEYIDGPSIYYCACWKKGICKLRFVQKNIVQQPGGGSVVKAIPYTLPNDILEKIEKMLQRVGWEGVIMIEVKEDLDTHKYYAIEANPRFWGPLQIAVDNGINFPEALLELNVEENKQKELFGYLWIGGYISGFFEKLQTKTDFQKFETIRSERITYNDVWLRDDTYAYFLVELFISVIIGIFHPIVKIFQNT